MPFIALSVIDARECQPTLRPKTPILFSFAWLTHLHWRCTQFIEFIEYYMEPSAIIASNRFVGIICHFNIFVCNVVAVAVISFCFGVMTLLFTHTITRTHRVREALTHAQTAIHKDKYTNRRLHSEYQIGWRQKQNVNTDSSGLEGGESICGKEQ